MKWETDFEPMTTEKAIKLRAHAMIMRMKNAGVPWAHCNIAALVAALELKEQYLKKFAGTDAGRKTAIEQFEMLEKGIIGYLPMPKEPKENKKDLQINN